MSDLTSVEIGVGLLAIWLATAFLLFKLIDRRDKPGIIKSAMAKEGAMLVHMAVLIVGAAMLIKGLHVFD